MEKIWVIGPLIIAVSTIFKLWTKIGRLIATTISKIAIILLFYLVFTPISILLKLLRIDFLNKIFDSKTNTYWISRTQQPQTMKNQF